MSLCILQWLVHNSVWDWMGKSRRKEADVSGRVWGSWGCRWEMRAKMELGHCLEWQTVKLLSMSQAVMLVIRYLVSELIESIDLECCLCRFTLTGYQGPAHITACGTCVGDGTWSSRRVSDHVEWLCLISCCVQFLNLFLCLSYLCFSFRVGGIFKKFFNWRVTIVLASAIKQCEPAISIHMSQPSCIPPHPIPLL